jgi:hypothetical protein
MSHRTFNTSSRPTLAQAEQMIRDVADEINASLRSLGYTPCPIADAEGVKLLRVYNAYGAAALILDGSYSADGEGSALGERLYQRYQDALAKLRRGEVVPGEASRASGRPVRPGEHTPKGAFSLDSQGQERDPAFERDTKW